MMTYKELNPDLSVPALYSNDTPEYMHTAISRLRLVAHTLTIETGRWSPLPSEQRLCPCGGIQTECHILEDCILVKDISMKHEQSFNKPTHMLLNCNDIDDANALYNLLIFFS